VQNLKLAIIVDLDGTLFDTSAVTHFVDGSVKPKDFKSFYNYACTKAPLNLGVWRVCDAFRAVSTIKFGIVVLTGRPEAYREATVDQLRRHGFSFDRLYMRRSHDKRSNAVMKLDYFVNEICYEFDPYLVIDDNPAVIEMWKDKGVATLALQGNAATHALINPAVRDEINAMLHPDNLTETQ
jgi:hypothetical protein